MKIIDFNDRREYIGLAAEFATLPTDCDDGSMFLAVDTKNVYVFYDGTWYILNT